MPLLLSFRNFFQFITFNNTKFNKTIMRELLKKLKINSIKLLQKYKNINTFLNLSKITIDLMAFSLDKIQKINQR